MEYDPPEVREGKTTAAVAYIFFVGAIIAIFMNLESKNKFASFHIRQALGLHILFFFLAVLVSGFNNTNISIAFWIFSMSLWIYGFSGVIQGRKNLIPFIGEFFQKWLNKIA